MRGQKRYLAEPIRCGDKRKNYSFVAELELRAVWEEQRWVRSRSVKRYHSRVKTFDHTMPQARSPQISILRARLTHSRSTLAVESQSSPRAKLSPAPHIVELHLPHTTAITQQPECY
ncbi:hypothetical protein PMIN06_002271 [Paraphaeosphaeria minitans]